MTENIQMLGFVLISMNAGRLVVNIN